MVRASRSRRSPPQVELIARVQELRRAGLLLQAFNAATKHAPLREWVGVEARLVAGQLAHDLGAPILGKAHLRLAWREAPRDARVAVWLARDIMGRRGPLATLEFLDATRGQVAGSREDEADLIVTRGVALAQFRDFGQAHSSLDEAALIDPGNASAILARAHVLIIEDRYSDALELTRQALAARPTMTKAIAMMADLLQIQGRDGDAVSALEEAAGTFEAAHLALQLAGAYSERGDNDALTRALDRYESLSPLLEAQGRRYLAALRADVAYGRGEFREMVELAELSQSWFHLWIAGRVKQGCQKGDRVLLPLGFVRQHHETCGPATMSAITQFWERPADHLEIAGEICYGGTTCQAERAWAESHGWAAREFTVSWGAAKALLDRGLPFSLTTFQGGSGHLQAVIGYDAPRGTLFLRDPNIRHHLEVVAEPFLEEQEFCGPRGMAMVPAEAADRLDGLSLPDERLYDHYFRLETMLLAHDRDGALVELEAITTESPGHRLALLGQYAIAVFDAAPAGRQAALDRWVDRYPKDIAMRARQLDSLEALGRHAELKASLAELCAGAHAHPAFRIRLGRLLATDARSHGEAIRWIRSAISLQPAEPAGYHALADALSRSDGAGRALELYRLAACLADKDEAVAMAYFSNARAAGRQAEALAFLEDRWLRLGRQSAAPAISLASALAELGQDQRAFEIYESAMETHRENGTLMLIAAVALQGRGRTEAAQILLDRANGRCRQSAYLSACAHIAMQRGDRHAAREAWGRLVAQDPVSIDGHHALARLACAEWGPAAALQHLGEAVSRAPHHIGLRGLELAWIRMLRPDRLEARARALVEVSPRDVDARLEWCSALAAQRRTGEAVEQARVALEIAPKDPRAAATLGCLLAQDGAGEEAREALLGAIRASVDVPEAVHTLVFRLSRTVEERRSALELLAGELRHRPTTGEGLRAFAASARLAWTADELSGFLEESLAARPDLPDAWSSVVRHVADPDRALAAAEQAAQRFPLRPEAWFDLAYVRNVRGETSSEIEALRQVLHLRPAWREAVRCLAQACLRSGCADEALALLSREFPTEPPDPDHEAQSASMLWDAGRRDEAMERLRGYLRLTPRSREGWDAMATWAGEQGRDLTRALARDIVAERPDDPGAWLGLARALRDPGDTPERLSAIWRALDLSPWDIEARDLEAELLADSGHLDQALAACSPAVWGERSPVELRGRRAWVIWRRGRRREATFMMRELLEESSSYLWGWRSLAAWLCALDDYREYAAAAGRWVFLEPGDPAAHTFHGDALLRCGQRALAKDALSNALRLDQGNGLAAGLLFEAQMADGELVEAEATLEAGKGRMARHVVLAREVRLRCARGERVRAAEAFRGLCLLSETDWNALAMAADGLIKCGQGERAAILLEESLQEPGGSPWRLAAWVDVVLAREINVSRCTELLRTTVDRGEVWSLACSHLVAGLGRIGARAPFWEFVGEHDQRLRAEDETWFSVLEVLIGWSEYSRARQWAQGWESRDRLGPDAYWKISLALRGSGEEEEATRVVGRARELLFDPHEGLSAWAGFDSARRGDLDAARRDIQDLEDADLETPHAFLVALVRGMLAIDAPAAGAGRQAFATARRWLREAQRRHPEYRTDALLSGAFRHAVDRIAAARGGWTSSVWRVWHKPPLPG